jgi:hypothetical protein
METVDIYAEPEDCDVIIYIRVKDTMRLFLLEQQLKNAHIEYDKEEVEDFKQEG